MRISEEILAVVALLGGTAASLAQHGDNGVIASHWIDTGDICTIYLSANTGAQLYHIHWYEADPNRPTASPEDLRSRPIHGDIPPGNLQQAMAAAAFAHGTTVPRPGSPEPQPSRDTLGEVDAQAFFKTLSGLDIVQAMRKRAELNKAIVDTGAGLAYGRLERKKRVVELYLQLAFGVTPTDE